MIVQSSLMADFSSQFTRELLLTKTEIKEILEFPKKAKNKEGQVFGNVLQGTCIYSFKHKIPDVSREFNVSIDNDITTLNKLQYETLKQNEIIHFYPNGYFIPLVHKGEFEIIRKMQKKSIPLKQIVVEISQGDLNLTGAKDYFSKSKTKVRLLRGKNINKYKIIKDVEEYVFNDYLKEKVEKNKNNIYIVGQEITGTTDKWRLHFALTEKEYLFLFGHTANKILLKDQKLNSFILGILNSKLLDWYFRKTSTNNHVMGYEIEQLPIPNISTKQQQPINSLVNYILFLKNANNDTVLPIYFENIIDACVYELYFPDEMHAANKGVFDHLKDLRPIDNAMTDEQKMSIINSEFKRLYDPYHPVRNNVETMENIEFVKTINESVKK
jgi:Alw26I/Eco31I/Esp3I family type II restriction m6 adenine DNA methyltransferase